MYVQKFEFVFLSPNTPPWRNDPSPPPQIKCCLEAIITLPQLLCNIDVGEGGKSILSHSFCEWLLGNYNILVTEYTPL